MQSYKIETWNKKGSNMLENFQNKLKSGKSLPRHRTSFYAFYVSAAIIVVVLTLVL